METTNETVRIPTTNGGVTVHCYHVTEDCDVWPEHGRDIPLPDAEKRGLSECERCNGLNMTGADNDPLKYIRELQNNE